MKKKPAKFQSLTEIVESIKRKEQVKIEASPTLSTTSTTSSLTSRLSAYIQTIRRRCKAEEAADKRCWLAGEFASLSTTDIGVGTDLHTGADVSVAIAPNA